MFRLDPEKMAGCCKNCGSTPEQHYLEGIGRISGCVVVHCLICDVRWHVRRKIDKGRKKQKETTMAKVEVGTKPVDISLSLKEVLDPIIDSILEEYDLSSDSDIKIIKLWPQGTYNVGQGPDTPDMRPLSVSYSKAALEIKLECE